MADLIDRQALRDAMYHEAFETDSDEQRWDSGCWIRYKMFERILDSLPPAQPERKAGRWIPVTERLPEVDENVLISYHYDEESEFFPPFDGVTISYWTGVKNRNIPHFADMGDACTVLAWMPLPEPYKEDSDGRPD